MRCVSTRVLPEPAPASTSSGPSPCSTAWRCGGFRSASRRSAGSAPGEVGAPNAVSIVTQARIDPPPARAGSAAGRRGTLLWTQLSKLGLGGLTVESLEARLEAGEPLGEGPDRVRNRVRQGGSVGGRPLPAPAPPPQPGAP